MKKHWMLWTLASALAACSSTVPLATSEEVPAAKGQVQVKEVANDNTRVKVQVKHLAAPQKINPGAKTFVVWTRPTEQARPQNMGALKVDKNLNGKLETVTPLKDFELFITAEPTPTVDAPSGNTLLSTRIARK